MGFVGLTIATTGLVSVSLVLVLGSYERTDVAADWPDYKSGVSISGELTLGSSVDTHAAWERRFRFSLKTTTTANSVALDPMCQPQNLSKAYLLVIERCSR